MKADAVLGAKPQPALTGAMVGTCPCGEPIMWSDRCPAEPPKICVACAALLFKAKPDAVIVAPSGVGFFTVHSDLSLDPGLPASP